MKTVHGDLVKLALEGEFDVIIHGCNCFHTMGAGIAKAISKTFPEALKADKATPYGERSKLGTISKAIARQDDHAITIVNAYTQFDWRGRGPKVDYHAVRACFGTVAKTFPDQRIGYPMIGAGLAGGNWEIISGVIEDELNNLDHTLVIFQP
jgi:O-acetyl-ADP-ribose deacetylase (regulator of RNase III)